MIASNLTIDLAPSTGRWSVRKDGQRVQIGGSEYPDRIVRPADHLGMSLSLMRRNSTTISRVSGTGISDAVTLRIRPAPSGSAQRNQVTDLLPWPQH